MCFSHCSMNLIMANRHSAQAVDTVSTSRSVLVNVAAPNRFDNIQNGRVT